MKYITMFAILVLTLIPIAVFIVHFDLPRWLGPVMGGCLGWLVSDYANRREDK